jgi:hypothetical protein
MHRLRGAPINDKLRKTDCSFGSTPRKAPSIQEHSPAAQGYRPTGDTIERDVMKIRAAIVLLGTALAMGSPAWAQGSLEHDDNGGGHPGTATAPRSGLGSYAHVRRHARAWHSRSHPRDLRTTGQGGGQGSPAREHKESSSPNGGDAGTK